MHRAGTSMATAALYAGLAACTTTPPVTAPAPEPPRGVRETPTHRVDPLLDYERRLRARAALLERQGRWPEAGFAWQALVLIDPEHEAGAAELDRRIQALAAERLQRARQALGRGNTDAAEQGFLGVLALRPGDTEAAAILRDIESARARRDLGQASRTLLTRRAPAGNKAGAPAPTPSNPVELEYVAMLAGNGAMADAIDTLERRLAAQPRDDAARRLLASLHFKRAQALSSSDPAAARAALAACLRLEPDHADATRLLKQLNASPGKPPAARPSP